MSWSFDFTRNGRTMNTFKPSVISKYFIKKILLKKKIPDTSWDLLLGAVSVTASSKLNAPFPPRTEVSSVEAVETHTHVPLLLFIAWKPIPSWYQPTKACARHLVSRHVSWIRVTYGGSVTWQGLSALQETCSHEFHLNTQRLFHADSGA